MGWNFFFPQQCGGEFSCTLCLALSFSGHSAIPGISIMLWPLRTNEVSLDCSRNSCQAKAGAHCLHPELLVPATVGNKGRNTQSAPGSLWSLLTCTTAWVELYHCYWNFQNSVTVPDCGQDVNLLMTAAQHTVTPPTAELERPPELS